MQTGWWCDNTNGGLCFSDMAIFGNFCGANKTGIITNGIFIIAPSMLV